MNRNGRVFAPLVMAIALSSCSGGSASSPSGSPAQPAPHPSTDAAPWGLPTNPMSLAEQAGLTPATQEFLTYHVHAHLDVFVNGRHVPVPGGIGIDITDPAVNQGTIDGAPAYGGISPPCQQPCISPLHTHDVTGVVHIEAPEKTESLFTLGRFFQEWGVRLDPSCVGGYCSPDATIAVYVDGGRRSGDPADIPLTAHEEIAIVIGSPPSSIPASYEFASAE